MARIERVSYRSGFVKRLRESRHLPAITVAAADLPEDLLALLDCHLPDLGGTYGDPSAGDPIHDELRIEHDEGDVRAVPRPQPRPACRRAARSALTSPIRAPESQAGRSSSVAFPPPQRLPL